MTSPPASTNVLLFKTAVVLLVFCFAECAAGTLDNSGQLQSNMTGKLPKSSCLKYGHSCWGGHGKRNGAASSNGAAMLRVREDGPIGNTRWYLSRLVQAPADLRLWRDEQDRHAMIARTADKHIQNENEVESDFAKRSEDTEDLTAESGAEDPETEEVVLMEEPSTSLGQKLRLYKLMKNNAEKLN